MEVDLMPSVACSFFHFQDGFKRYALPTVLSPAFLATMRPTAVEAEAALRPSTNVDMNNPIAMNASECIGFDVPFTRLCNECVTYSGH